ncbi:isocitrate lyase/phosphoenolpyruvate mutase family protein [Streptomyces sp. NBC_00133]
MATSPWEYSRSHPWPDGEELPKEEADLARWIRDRIEL